MDVYASKLSSGSQVSLVTTAAKQAFITFLSPYARKRVQ